VLPALDTISRFTCPQIIPHKLACGENCTLCTPCTDLPCSNCSENFPGSSFHHPISKYANRPSVLPFRKKGVYFMFCSWTTVKHAQFHISCIATPQQCTWTFVAYYCDNDIQFLTCTCQYVLRMSISCIVICLYEVTLALSH
jgi:hypothetical protein